MENWGVEKGGMVVTEDQIDRGIWRQGGREERKRGTLTRQFWFL
jgi:hypothetical protein